MNRLTAGSAPDWSESTWQHPNAELRSAPSLERRRLRAYGLILLADATVLHLAFAVAALIWQGHWQDPRAMLAAATMLPAYLTIALYNGTYGVRSLSDWRFAVRKALLALAISAGLVNFVAFSAKAGADPSRGPATLGLLLTGIGLIGVRRAVAVLVGWLWNGRVRNLLVIDHGGPSFPLAEAQTVSAAEYGIDPASHDPFMLDRLGKLLRNQDQVIVSCPQERRREWAFLLKSAGVHGEIVSEPAHRLGSVGVHRYDALGRTTLVVSTGPLGLRARIAKRLFDVIVALVALAALFPLLLAVALLIKLEDGGPVLFVQRRLGRGNQFFRMLKFRSMRTDRLDADGARSTARGDGRITRTGAFIRRTSIDELPQLINVLSGEMSIVGPRPHAVGSRANDRYFWEVDRRYWQRHCLKPGLTGLAQVRGHRGTTECEEDLTERLQSDLEYIANWSLLGDIEIMLMTALVLRHDKAY